MAKSGLLYMAFFVLYTQMSFAQDKMYKLTIGGGAGVSTFIKYVKQPAISAKVFGEKLIDEENRKYFYIAAEYSSLKAIDPVTKPFDNGTTTFTYKGAKLITLSGGGKIILDNNIFYGVGMGLGIYTQGVPSQYFSEPLLNFVQYKKGNGGWGIGSTAQFGYLFHNFQVSLNYH